jgi:hypothetical protein
MQQSTSARHHSRVQSKLRNKQEKVAHLTQKRSPQTRI